MRVGFHILTIRFLTVTLIALGFGSSPRCAYASDPCIQSADNLFAAGFWDAAITEYKRHLFFHPETPQRDSCYIRISRSYKELGDLENALTTVRESMSFAIADSVRQERRLDMGDILLRQGELASAELEFARARTFAQYPTIQERATLRLAVVQLRAYRWRDARQSLSSGNVWKKDGDTATIDSLFGALESLTLKSPVTARRLSTFLPGAGQIYAGSPIKGIHSLALNTVFGAMLVSSILDQRIGLMISHVSLFGRYYQGGRYRAGRMAVEYNAKRMAPLIEAVIKEIQRIDPGGLCEPRVTGRASRALPAAAVYSP